MLHTIAALSDQCARIAITRRSDSRNTHLRRRLMRLNMPLLSVVNRVRWGMVLCGEEEFGRHLYRILNRFRVRVRSLVRSLDNEERSDELLALANMCME